MPRHTTTPTSFLGSLLRNLASSRAKLRSGEDRRRWKDAVQASLDRD